MTNIAKKLTLGRKHVKEEEEKLEERQRYIERGNIGEVFVYTGRKMLSQDVKGSLVRLETPEPSVAALTIAPSAKRTIIISPER